MEVGGLLITKKRLIGGFIGLLLFLALPITIWQVSRLQDIRQQAAPSSRLYLDPSEISTTTACIESTVDLVLDPGENIVSIVEVGLTYDPSVIEITDIQASESFPSTLEPFSASNGSASASFSIGNSVVRAVQEVTSVATIKYRPLKAGSVTIGINTSNTRVLSLAPEDQPTENVLSNASGSTITITQNSVCLDSGPTPIIPTDVPLPTPTPGPPYCPADGASCSWSPVSGATEYKVTITDESTGEKIVDTTTTGTNITFTPYINRRYICQVSAINECGTGPEGEGFNTCAPGPSPTPTRTPTPTMTPTLTRTPTPTMTPTPTLTPTLVPTGTPAPTSTPAPTNTPVPTATPTTPPVPQKSTDTPTPPQKMEQPGGTIQTIGIIGGIVFAVIAGALLLAL